MNTYRIFAIFFSVTGCLVTIAATNIPMFTIGAVCLIEAAYLFIRGASDDLE